MNTCFEEANVDILLGSGGAPEGVLAACALKCLGGEIQGILLPEDEAQIERCKKMGVDLDKVYYIDDLVKGNEVAFSATGVTYGELLAGVKYLDNNKATTETLVLRAETGTVRFIKSIHQLDKKPGYAK